MGGEEFYVGYHPLSPRGLARFLRARVTTLLLLAAAVGVGAAAAARPLGHGAFEYGTTREFTGQVVGVPYPMLAVARPGGGTPAASYYLLVGRGKHGAGQAVAELDGRPVRLRGTLIHRDGSTMIELAAVPVPSGDRPVTLDAPEPLGSVTLTGEIVDSKCHLGVMNPGEGVSHRACALRCISGGAPPLLVVTDAAGRAQRFILTDPAGGTVGARVLDLLAEPVRITGQVSRRGDVLYLAVDPSTIERLP
jgi:hypothetical protein